VRCVERKAHEISPQSPQSADYARTNQAVSCSVQAQDGDRTPHEVSGDVDRQRLPCALYQYRKWYQAYRGKRLVYEKIWRVASREEMAHEQA
jgi:hypothetical protein